jgi:hypothetical protein
MSFSVLAEKCLKSETRNLDLPGRSSLAILTLHPVFSRISLILKPPLPIIEPHWPVGTIM